MGQENVFTIFPKHQLSKLDILFLFFVLLGKIGEFLDKRANAQCCKPVHEKVE